MDNYDQYMDDLDRLDRMHFQKLFLVHTQDYQRDSIVVDAHSKIMAYKAHRR